jgi:uncharacterized membrane protein YkoI
MNTWRSALTLLWLSVAAAGGVRAASPPPAAHNEATHEVSMEQAVKLVERQYHARVVKAATQKSGAQVFYALRLLDDSGKVWTVHVDAASGVVQ